jgi:hypothetical protein
MNPSGSVPLRMRHVEVLLSPLPQPFVGSGLTRPRSGCPCSTSMDGLELPHGHLSARPGRLWLDEVGCNLRHVELGTNGPIELLPHRPSQGVRLSRGKRDPCAFRRRVRSRPAPARHGRVDRTHRTPQKCPSTPDWSGLSPIGKQHQHDDGSYADRDGGDHECQVRARDECLSGMGNCCEQFAELARRALGNV